jgi:3-phenylpropionate/trans-cinnamate dioxygenase ferredoxin reductase subunit
MVRIVIIGAGECGVRAALALREYGFEGSVDLVNGEGLMPYERPPLSKARESALTTKPIAGSNDLVAKSITFHSGITANQISRSNHVVTLSNGVVLPYDRLLLATGARPNRLMIKGLDNANAMYLRSFDDARAIHQSLAPGKRLTIIGGGFIGLELAALARQAGVLVTVLEAGPRLLGRAVPAKIASIIEARHRAETVDIQCGIKIESIDPSGTIAIADGRIFESDIIIAGVGSLPNTALAENAGLTIENGIAVDALLRTSDPMIFAAGDCCSFPHPLYGGARIRIESWRAAQEQGSHVARAMLGASEPYNAVPWFWSDQYDLTLQIAGLSGMATNTIRRDIGQHDFILFHLDDDGRLLAASGIGIGNGIARDIRLAEMLIAKRAHPDPTLLADPNTKLKALLAL